MKINSIEMFSEEGWKLVHNDIDIKNAVRNQDDEMALADGFISFCEIWARDNDIDYPEEYEAVLLDRWADYLLDD